RSAATLGPPLFATGSTEKLSGLIGGVQAGYNWQSGNWVGGIEADIQVSGQGAIPTYVCPGAICNPTVVDFDAPVTASFVQGNKLDSFGTLRARFGTTITPDLIAYATGGLAVGSIRTTVNLSGTAVDADGNVNVVTSPVSVLAIKPGWTVGAGLEARLFGNVTGKVEYLYMDFGAVSAAVTNGLNATPIALASSSHVTDNIVRAGVNYKFDPALGGYDGVPGIGIPLVLKGAPSKAPPYAAPIAIAWSWAGPYLGINVGYSAGKSKTDTGFSDAGAGSPLFATASSDNLNGVIAGFSAGVDENGNVTATAAGVGFYDHRTKAGWTAGAGLEAHLSGNLTGKVEYLYLDFGTVSTSAINQLNSTPLAISLDSHV